MMSAFDQSLKRTSDEVQRIATEARANSRRRWVPGKEEDDPSAIEQVRIQYDLNTISPEEGIVEVEPPAANILGIEPGVISVWFLTGLATQRVFFDERLGLFGTAWGPDSSTGKYVDLGFRTDDPIDAFLA